MKVTLLGHASLLVQMGDTNILMDPVFQDPFEEGAVVSCPRREVHRENLPKIDLAIISHAHPDHFDIPSLATLPRDCQVMCPNDRTILYALERMGFKNVHATRDMTLLKFPGYDLLTTRSSVTNVTEFGVLFKTPTAVFWNQVDTILSPETIRTVLQAAGPVDLLFAMHASQNFGFFEHRNAGFPYEMHQMNLNTAMAIRPRMVVPGAAGFRFCGDVEWCNAFLFPVSRDLFVEDIARVAPDLACELGNPGDVFEIEANTVTRHAGASRFASMMEDDTARLNFNPTSTIPALVDTNPGGYPSDELSETVNDVLQRLADFVAGEEGSTDHVVKVYASLRTSYAAEIVFPDGSERRLRIGWDEGAPPSAKWDQDATRRASSLHRIPASALVGWVRREKSYFYLRAFSRIFTTGYALTISEGGARVERRDAPDLLSHYLQRKSEDAHLALKVRLDKQLEPFVEST